MRKTYAARGLLDWQMALNVGGAILRICFSGGQMGHNGVVPAKYVTDNPAIQRIIEESPQFTSGRVVLLSEEPLGRKTDRNKEETDDDGKH